MISIIGYGFVGKAVHAAFPGATCLIDPLLGTSLSDIDKETTYAFICVPTPSNSDGSIDDGIVLETVTYLLQNTSAKIIIKSTILPSTIDKINSFFIGRICINPEFLTERRAVEDMLNAETIVIGGDDRNIREAVWDLYANESRCKALNASFVSLREACWIKYITNTMLAAKVALLNEYYSEIGNRNSWDRIIKVLQKDDRLGTSHWLVPGSDGKFGFGGACFPKDLNALLHKTQNLSILEIVKQSNDKIRKQYELDEREQSQGIKF